jgi:hypothetical protein
MAAYLSLMRNTFIKTNEIRGIQTGNSRIQHMIRTVGKLPKAPAPELQSYRRIDHYDTLMDRSIVRITTGCR